ncbi:hypothetical protein [Nocardia pseudovaccinii]|uniref:hypothetical protein n=1 Tax=Nocardia pseudovaccinii TaxID=189540 RepID=UPI0007A537D3|nr:hypothetical protein [Nocardia pseudovaccinii]
MSTLDVEITSQTTAKAMWPDAEPVELTASDRTALSVEIHKFSTRRAAEAGASVEVTITDGGRKRFVTVTPDGAATRSTPSTPVPILDNTPTAPQPPVDHTSTTEAADPTAAAAPTDAASPPQEPADEPVVVAAEPIIYTDAPEPTPPIQPRTTSPPAAEAAPPLPPPQPVGARTAAARPPAVVPRTLAPLAAKRSAPVMFEPARRGVRGRLNAALHLSLAPKPDSVEMRLRTAAVIIAGPIPEFKVVTVANLKGGVGKTPMAIGLASTMATHRGASSVVCADLSEVGGSLADRAAAAPTPDQNVIALLSAADEIRQRPATLTRLMTRQPTGEDLIAGRQGLAGTAPLEVEQAAALAAIVSRHREILIADTGNNQLAGSWQWAVSRADVLVVPVPLRRDAAIAAARMLLDIADIDPEVLARTVVIVTDGPGDQPMVETEAVDTFVRLDVAKVLRMPYEPLFAGGEPIVTSQMRATTTESLTVIAATVVELMTAAR